MATMTLSLPVPLTAQQITNLGALLVAAINNQTTLQNNKATDTAAIQNNLTTAQAQTQTDIGAAPMVLAQDVLNANRIQANLTTVTANYDAAIATSKANQAILAKDLAVGYSMQPVVCTVDTNGIVTRTDSNTVVSWMKISPPPKS